MNQPAKDGRETLQEPPLTCPHIDAFLSCAQAPQELKDELEAIKSINSQLRYGLWSERERANAAQAEIARLKEAEDVLERNGFRRCDIAACNCNSWHFVGGFKARFDEIKQVVEDAGYSTNGRTLLDAVKHMAKDATPLPVAEDVVGRNAALQEAAAHLRDMGYWTQGAAVLSLCTGVCTGACTGGSSDGR